MISFSLSLLALVVGYFVYGKFVDHIFGPDNRESPAVVKADVCFLESELSKTSSP